MTSSKITCGDQVVFYAPEDVRIEPMFVRPTPKKGEVLVKVEACAICGTDLKSFHFGNPRIKPPQTMGHEFCGIIDELGPDVFEYQKGQRVVMATTMGCGSCWYCKQGYSNICPDVEAIGFHYPGAMAPYVIVPEKGVRQKHLVEVGTLDPVIASLAEPMSCVINNVTRVPANEVESVLLLGLGPLGLLHAVCLKQWGVQQIVCVEYPGLRFEIARQMGLIVLSPDEIDSKYLELSQGRGFDLVIITAPSQAVQAKAPDYARKRGYVSYFASLPAGSEMLSMNSRTIHYKELMLYGTSDSTPQHVQQGVEILRQAESEVRTLITHTPAMSQFQEALTDISEGRAVKVVLLPSGESS